MSCSACPVDASGPDTGLCLEQLNKKGMEADQFDKWQPKFQRKQKEFSKVSHMIMICMKRQVGPSLPPSLPPSV